MIERIIRPAALADLGEILRIYCRARDYMAASGNPTQWGKTNPPVALLRQDIASGDLYVMEEAGQLIGVFAMLSGPDPAYAYIEGNWHSEAPYGVIHRIASSGTAKGVLASCLQFASQQYKYLRIDTHENNKTMQHLLEKHGFTRCGTIYLENGDPRIAYDRT